MFTEEELFDIARCSTEETMLAVKAIQDSPSKIEALLLGFIAQNLQWLTTTTDDAPFDFDAYLPENLWPIHSTNTTTYPFMSDDDFTDWLDTVSKALINQGYTILEQTVEGESPFQALFFKVISSDRVYLNIFHSRN